MNLSVVIRTRDKEEHFERLIENLSRQTLQPSEIIVVDNYSTKENLRHLYRNFQKIARKCFERRARLKLVTLADDEFSHPYSTNLGIAAAENELVCLTNAHSLPVSLHWLHDGAKHFNDARVAGVSGYFIPHKKGKTIDTVNASMYEFSQKIIVRQDWCSTINCIVRKSLWKIYPFDENLPKIIPETRRYGLEDYDWSKEMVARGFRIVVDPLFSVFHAHEKGLGDVRRNVAGYFVYRRIQQKINTLSRPRKSFSKVFETKTVEAIEVSV